MLGSRPPRPGNKQTERLRVQVGAQELRSRREEPAGARTEPPPPPGARAQGPRGPGPGGEPGGEPGGAASGRRATVLAAGGGPLAAVVYRAPALLHA